MSVRHPRPLPEHGSGLQWGLPFGGLLLVVEIAREQGLA